jgi:uncharacterized protein (TIGR02118 family)
MASSVTLIAPEGGGLRRSDRRRFVRLLGMGLAAGAGAAAAFSSNLANGADGSTSGNAKVLFILFRKPDLTHEQMASLWQGDRHTSIVKKVPGLRRWVQNHLVQPPSAASADGVGELWFDNADALGKGMASPEMAAAFDDAKGFLDLEKSYALVVAERMIVE